MRASLLQANVEEETGPLSTTVLFQVPFQVPHEPVESMKADEASLLGLSACYYAPVLRQLATCL